mgnify:CR=1 FL=1
MRKKPTCIICCLKSEGVEMAEGSTTDHCVDCREAVWVAPSGYLFSLQVDVLCGSCAVERARKAGERIELVKPNADQAREMAAHGMPDINKVHAWATRYFNKWRQGS